MADRPLHIAIDGRELFGKPTGVGRYLLEVLKEWAQVPHRYTRDRSGRAHGCTAPAGRQVSMGGRGRSRCRHAVGADTPAARAGPDQARRLLCAREHRAAPAALSVRRGRARRVVLCAPRMVRPPRRLAAALADALGRPARPDGGDHLRILAAGDRPIPAHAARQDRGRAPGAPAEQHSHARRLASPSCCTLARCSIAAASTT